MGQDRIESARAESEARDAVTHRTSRGPVSREVDAAMARYLAAEAYHGHEAEEPEAEETEETDSGSRPPG